MDFNDLKKIQSKLTDLSIIEALNIIKNNLNKIGIKHDNFVSEKKLVTNQEVEKVIELSSKK